METKPKTNADRIRNMTDEELASFLGDLDFKCWLEWLKAPVEDSEK